MRGSYPVLAAHVAVPACRHLVAAGLLSAESAQASLANVDLRAAISPCGRKARLLRASPSPPQPAARSAASTAVRVSLSVLMAEKSSWSHLRATARRHAAGNLSNGEIETLIRHQIARQMRLTQGATHV